MWLAWAAAGVLYGILTYVNRDEIAAEMSARIGEPVEQGEPMSGVQLVVAAVLIGLWIFIVASMRGGANWARIALAVFGGLSAFYGMLGVFGLGVLLSVGPLGALQGLAMLAQVAAAIGGIVFMFKPDAKPHFRRI
jgi:hypothetical protein